MSYKARKHIWPVALMSLVVFGVVAFVVALSAMQPQAAQADGCDHITDPIQRAQCDARHRTAGLDHTDAAHTHAGGGGTPSADEDDLVSSSTSASANVKLTLTIAELPDVALDDGSSIVLYLEDDFKVPDDIDRDDVYFIVPGSNNQRTNNGGRVFPTYGVEIDDDNHFGGDDDWSIQVFLPDFDTRDVDAAAGFQGPRMGETLELVITKGAGINNPSEAHDSNNTYTSGYKWSYAVVEPGDDVPDAPEANTDDDLFVRSKISLDDEDNDRGYELTVTGSGFNNGTSAAVHVLHNARYHVAAYWETLDCAGMKAAMGSEDDKFCFHYTLNTSDMTYSLGSGMPAFTALSDEEKMEVSEMVQSRLLCSTVLREGSREGIATVGSDDKVAVTFEVTVPTFQSGDQNYICMVDGEGRASVSDVEQFELQPSIRIVPNSAAAGDTVTVFAQDYPRGGGGLQELKIAGQVVYPPSAARSGNAIDVDSTSIGNDGSATATFDLPGSLSGNALEGTLRIDAKWADDGEDTKLTITGSQLTLSKSEALPNELITITGDGFGGDHIDVADITIDGVALLVDDDSQDDGHVDISSAGQFVASIILWPEDDRGSNPTLIAGTHTIDVEDDAGFSGSAVIVIAEPSIKVTPGVAGPRDVIAITGENWPADNLDGAGPVAVSINVDDGVRQRNYSVFADSSGRFRQEHRVASNVAIPSTNQVKVSLSTDIVKVASFEVPSAILSVEPGTGQPGDTITLSVDGMPVYDNVDEVKIAGRSVLPSGNFSTDATGSVTVDGVLIPGIDAGVYSVQLEVSETVAIGSLEVLSEGPIGTDTPVAEAVEALGDSLVAVFYFDDVGKTWSFYDPRPEFADLNTLSDMVGGEAYWILVSETVEDVVLNDKARNLTCRGDDCWNLEVW